MKKISILIKTLVLMICIFMGVNGISAINYTEYKKGDIIFVKLNDTEKLEFYVLTDSKESDSTVTAISKNVVGDKMDYTSLNEYINTKLKDSWTNVSSIKIPEITTLLGNEVDLTEETFVFSEPKYAIFENTYWTSTGSEKKWVLGKNTDSVGSASQILVNETAYFRPIITVDKKKVVNGTYITEEEYAWDNFVALFKNSELVKYYKNEDGYIIDISSDDSSMKIILNDGTGYRYTNFKYEDGILSYVAPATIVDEEHYLLDNFWIEETINTLIKLKEYDEDKVKLIFEKIDEEKLTLKDYGVELTTKEYKYSDKVDGVTSETTIEYYTKFKLDLVNGFPKLNKSNEKNESTPVENPDTGNFGKTSIFIIIIICICGLAYIGIRKKSLFPKYN